MTTKSQMIERCRRLLSGGFPSNRDRVRDAEIEKHLESAMNRLLKTEVLNTTFNIDGATIPDGVVLGTYENVSVTGGLNDTCTVKLPVTPMYLPEKMGVFSVYPSSYPEAEFIPIPAGQYYILQQVKEVNSLLGRVPYVWEGQKLTIYRNIIGDGIFTVDLKIAIADLSQYGPNDPLPLSPELEEQAIQSVVAIYIAEPRTIRDESFQASPENFIK
jgi:hypothetical protein